jgi:tetratricopeptide (TPR) repeat protein
MNKRLAFLEQTTRAGTADAFAWYALALEYRRESRVDDAIATFEALKAKDAGYLPMYLMAGQTLLEAGKPDLAAVWLESGIALAREKGDAKALGELESALAEAREG